MLSLSSTSIIAVAAGAAHPPVTPPQFDRVMFFGFVAMIFTLVFAFELTRSSVGMLMFSVGLAAWATYGFLQGAWPLGITESVWAAVAAVRWWRNWRIEIGNKQPPRRELEIPIDPSRSESRVERLFGSK